MNFQPGPMGGGMPPLDQNGYAMPQQQPQQQVNPLAQRMAAPMQDNAAMMPQGMTPSAGAPAMESAMAPPAMAPPGIAPMAEATAAAPSGIDAPIEAGGEANYAAMGAKIGEQISGLANQGPSMADRIIDQYLSRPIGGY